MPIAEGLLLAKAGESFIKDIYGTLKDKAVKKWQSFDWYTAQKRYYEKIYKNFSTVRVLGKPEPISLEDIYIDVHILSKPTAIHRFDFQNVKDNPEILEINQLRIDSLDLIKGDSYQKFYILGKPGAGKTTFLKYVALKASQNEIKKIPIFVSLKEWSDSNLDLISFLVKQFDICGFPDSQPLIEYILDLGLAIILFDGLDETQIENGKRDKVLIELNNFSQKYDSTQILITCRNAANDYNFNDFIYLEIADFNEQQIYSYTKKWFFDDEVFAHFTYEFNRKENKPLREIASIPLLLSLLCLDFEERKNFPNKRIDIYEIGLDALLKTWDSSRNIKRDFYYKNLSVIQKKEMFAFISKETYEKHEIYIEKRRLCKLIKDYLKTDSDIEYDKNIDAEGILNAIEAHHGILIQRAYNIYSFSHLTFQEYYFAQYAVENFTESNYRDLLSTEKITNNQWHEVILNIASLLDDGEYFAKTLLKSTTQIISYDKTLLGFLSWSDIKSKSVESKSKIAMIRLFYIFIGLIIDFALEISYQEKSKFNTRSVFSHARSENIDEEMYIHYLEYHNSALELIDTLKRAYVLLDDKRLAEAIDFALKFALLLDNRIATENKIESSKFENFDLGNASRISSNIESNLAVDFMFTITYLTTSMFLQDNNSFLANISQESLITFWKKFQMKVDIVNNYNLKDFNKEIFSLTETQKKEYWTDLSNHLLELSSNFLNFGKSWKFTRDQIQTLRHYFRANRLLINCLSVISINNKKEIENNLFSTF